MRFSIIKIVFIFLCFLTIFVVSFYVQENKIKNRFLNKIHQNKSYEDPLINNLYQDFKIITKYNDSNQLVKFRLSDFPFVLTWITITEKNNEKDIFSDLVGFANGMNDDTKIDIYLNYKFWKDLTEIEKRSVLYHELLHDCYNLEHVNDSCDLLNPKLNICENIDLNKKLYFKINSTK